VAKYFRLPGSLRTRLEECGINVSAVLRRARLPQNTLNQVRILLDTDAMFALWRAIEELTDDPAVGVKTGTENKLERFHPMALAVLSTDTFGLAIERLARYKKLCAPEEISSEFNDTDWSIQFHYLLAPGVPPAILVEHTFAWVLTIARQGSGKPICPLRVELMQPRKHVKALEQHFGCPVVCGANRNAIVFRASEALCPFVTKNPELLDALEPQFEKELKQLDSDDSLVDLVRGAIQQQIAGSRPTTESVAHDLRMSSRTLQRKLQEVGTSFQQVLDDTRRQMARYYLEHSVLELSEAAYLLGYEDVASFGRAFRSWEGLPPSVWRETHRSPTVN
jgi:AraC-like DNA-binding protein